MSISIWNLFVVIFVSDLFDFYMALLFTAVWLLAEVEKLMKNDKVFSLLSCSCLDFHRRNWIWACSRVTVGLRLLYKTKWEYWDLICALLFLLNIFSVNKQSIDILSGYIKMFLAQLFDLTGNGFYYLIFNILLLFFNFLQLKWAFEN